MYKTYYKPIVAFGAEIYIKDNADIDMFFENST